VRARVCRSGPTCASASCKIIKDESRQSSIMNSVTPGSVVKREERESNTFIDGTEARLINIPSTVYLFGIHGISFLRSTERGWRASMPPRIKTACPKQLNLSRGLVFPLFDSTLSRRSLRNLSSAATRRNGVFSQSRPKILYYRL